VTTPSLCLANKTHFVVRDETEFFVEGAAFLGGVEHEAVEMFGVRPFDYFFKKQCRDPPFSPFGLGEDVHDRPLPLLANG